MCKHGASALGFLDGYARLWLATDGRFPFSLRGTTVFRMRRKMMSLTIELDEQTAAVVQALAANENRSVNEVIRDAVAAYPGKRKRPLPKGVGKYRSGQSDIAQNLRESLRKDVQEGKWP
jgi:hypothetical protein